MLSNKMLQKESKYLQSIVTTEPKNYIKPVRVI